MAEQAEHDLVLAKTNRINLLYDFYGKLLTDKQMTFLTYYFHDDFSLGEIADVFGISRQAVSEHIKRAEQALEEYETKLQLLQKHERRWQIYREMESAGATALPDKVREWTALLRGIE
ncbi:MAG: YlxM family DNA-binding protein [Paenibacillaceae bacterium]|nr:YlxM family DNA-binding protein [Paenibacillaceae bacterium]